MALTDSLGLSFLPTEENGPRPGETGARLEDILQIIGLRLPRVLGARAISSPELLNSPGGAALPNPGQGGDVLANVIVQSILRGMPGASPGGAADPAGSFAPARGVSASSSSVHPIPERTTPRVIPIGPPDPPPSHSPFNASFPSVEERRPLKKFENPYGGGNSIY